MPHRNKAITKEVQDKLTPMIVLQNLIEGKGYLDKEFFAKKGITLTSCNC